MAFEFPYHNTIRATRTALGMSQQELADICGFSGNASICEVELNVKRIGQGRKTYILDTLKSRIRDFSSKKRAFIEYKTALNLIDIWYQENGYEKTPPSAYTKYLLVKQAAWLCYESGEIKG